MTPNGCSVKLYALLLSLSIQFNGISCAWRHRDGPRIVSPWQTPALTLAPWKTVLEVSQSTLICQGAPPQGLPAEFAQHESLLEICAMTQLGGRPDANLGAFCPAYTPHLYPYFVETNGPGPHVLLKRYCAVKCFCATEKISELVNNNILPSVALNRRRYQVVPKARWRYSVEMGRWGLVGLHNAYPRILGRPIRQGPTIFTGLREPLQTTEYDVESAFAALLICNQEMPAWPAGFPLWSREPDAAHVFSWQRRGYWKLKDICASSEFGGNPEGNAGGRCHRNKLIFDDESSHPYLSWRYEPDAKVVLSAIPVIAYCLLFCSCGINLQERPAKAINTVFFPGGGLVDLHFDHNDIQQLVTFPFFGRLPRLTGMVYHGYIPNHFIPRSIITHTLVTANRIVGAGPSPIQSPLSPPIPIRESERLVTVLGNTRLPAGRLPLDRAGLYRWLDLPPDGLPATDNPLWRPVALSLATGGGSSDPSLASFRSGSAFEDRYVAPFVAATGGSSSVGNGDRGRTTCPHTTFLETPCALCVARTGSGPCQRMADCQIDGAANEDEAMGVGSSGGGEGGQGSSGGGGGDGCACVEGSSISTEIAHALGLDPVNPPETACVRWTALVQAAAMMSRREGLGNQRSARGNLRGTRRNDKRGFGLDEVVCRCNSSYVARACCDLVLGVLG